MSCLLLLPPSPPSSNRFNILTAAASPRAVSLNESHVEEAALEWFGALGYAIGHGPQIAPGEASAERDSFADVVLAARLRDAIQRLNPEPNAGGADRPQRP